MKQLVWLLCIVILFGCADTIDRSENIPTKESVNQSIPVSIYFTMSPLFDESSISDLNIHIISPQDDLEQSINLFSPNIIYVDATTIDLIDRQLINKYYLSGVGIAGLNIPLSTLADLVNVTATMNDLKPLDKGFYISFLYKLQRDGNNNFGQYTDHYMTLEGAHGGISEMINHARCQTWELPNSGCK